MAYPAAVILHPSAHFVNDVFEKPVVEQFEIGQGIVVRTNNDITAEEQQHDDSLAGNPSGEQLIEKVDKLFIVDVLNVHLWQEKIDD